MPSMKDSPDFCSVSVPAACASDALDGFCRAAWASERDPALQRWLNRALSTRSGSRGMDTPQRREAAMRAAPKQTTLAPSLPWRIFRGVMEPEYAAKRARREAAIRREPERGSGAPFFHGGERARVSKMIAAGGDGDIVAAVFSSVRTRLFSTNAGWKKRSDSAMTWKR